MGFYDPVNWFGDLALQEPDMFDIKGDRGPTFPHYQAGTVVTDKFAGEHTWVLTGRVSYQFMAYEGKWPD